MGVRLGAGLFYRRCQGSRIDIADVYKLDIVLVLLDRRKMVGGNATAADRAMRIFRPMIFSSRRIIDILTNGTQ